MILSEYRCTCGKLLLKGIFFDGTLEIKCKRCGHINNIGSVKLKSDVDRYLIIADKSGNIRNVSDSACRILGYSTEELIGAPYTKVNTTMLDEMAMKFFGPRSVLREDNYLQMETFHRHKNGKMIPVSILLRIYTSKSESDEKYILAIASITKSSVEETNIKVPVLQFEDNACDFYFDIDTHAMTEYISPSAIIVFKLSSDYILGKNYFDFTPVKSIVKAKEAFVYFSTRQQPYRMKSDIQLDTKGKKICSDLYFTPRSDEYGMFIGYRVLGWVIKK